MRLTILKLNSNKPFHMLSVWLKAVSILGVLSFSSSLYAQRVQPMVYELSPTGAGASTSLRIENTKSTPMTMEFVATKMMIDEVGNETNQPADDDFLIFPPQALIQPGKTQVVRVKYVGDPKLDHSVAYRVSVKQLPVTLEKSGSTGVAMLVNFNTLANVVPTSSSADLAVVEIAPAENGQWSVTVENRGDKYARLSKTKWRVESTDGSVDARVLSKSEVGAMTDLNLVLPKQKLSQTIPAIQGFNPAQTRIVIENASS